MPSRGASALGSRNDSFGSLPQPTEAGDAVSSTIGGIEDDERRLRFWLRSLSQQLVHQAAGPSTTATATTTKRQAKGEAQHSAAASPRGTNGHPQQAPSASGRAQQHGASSCSTSVLQLTTSPPAALPGLSWRETSDALDRRDQRLQNLPRHVCADVVEADIQRSLYDIRDMPRRRMLRRKLRELVLRSVHEPRCQPPLHYYQGVHDILAVVLSVSTHGAATRLSRCGSSTADLAAAADEAGGSAAPSRPQPPPSDGKPPAQATHVSDSVTEGEDEDDGGGALAAEPDYSDNALVSNASFTPEVMDDAEFERAAQLCALLLVTKFRRFAKPDLSETLHLLCGIHGIVAAENAELAELLTSSMLGPDTHYAMSWLLTWFGHDWHGHDELLRVIFDACVEWPGDLAIAYICAAMILRYGPDVVKELGEDAFTDPMGFGPVHQAMKSLPTRVLYKRRVHVAASAGGGSARRRKRQFVVEDDDAPMRLLKKRDQQATLRQIIAAARSLEERHRASLERWLTHRDASGFPALEQVAAAARRPGAGADDDEQGDPASKAPAKEPRKWWPTIVVVGVLATQVALAYSANNAFPGGVSIGV